MLSTVRNVVLDKKYARYSAGQNLATTAIGKPAHIISLFPTEVVIDTHSVPSFQFVVESVATDFVAALSTCTFHFSSLAW